jgi:hypothetical protein
MRQCPRAQENSRSSVAQRSATCNVDVFSITSEIAWLTPCCEREFMGLSLANCQIYLTLQRLINKKEKLCPTSENIARAIAAITAALVTQPVVGRTINSYLPKTRLRVSPSLRRVGDWITVMNTTPDNWAVNTSSLSFAEVNTLRSGGAGSGSSLNQIALFTGDTNNFCHQRYGVASAVPNGFTYVGLLRDISDSVLVDVTFNDNGDTARSPRYERPVPFLGFRWAWLSCAGSSAKVGWFLIPSFQGSIPTPRIALVTRYNLMLWSQDSDWGVAVNHATHNWPNRK